MSSEKLRWTRLSNRRSSDGCASACTLYHVIHVNYSRVTEHLNKAGELAKVPLEQIVLVLFLTDYTQVTYILKEGKSIAAERNSAMTGTPRDRDLDTAQSEIQRRLLLRQNDSRATRDNPGAPRPNPAKVITPRVDPFVLAPGEYALYEKSLAAGDFTAIVSVKGVPTRQRRISPDSRTNVTVAVDIDRRHKDGKVIDDALGMDNLVIGNGNNFDVPADGNLHSVEVTILNGSNFTVKIEIEFRNQNPI